MSSAELSLFSYEILGLVGRTGAGAHDLLRLARRGKMLDWAGESQYYAEPKRLARLGYLEARKEPGKTRERTVYRLTQKGLERSQAVRPDAGRLHPVEERAPAPPADRRSGRRGRDAREPRRPPRGARRPRATARRQRRDRDGPPPPQQVPPARDRLPARATSSSTQSSSPRSSASSRPPVAAGRRSLELRAGSGGNGARGLVREDLALHALERIVDRLAVAPELVAHRLVGMAVEIQA